MKRHATRLIALGVLTILLALCLPQAALADTSGILGATTPSTSPAQEGAILGVEPAPPVSTPPPAYTPGTPAAPDAATALITPLYPFNGELYNVMLDYQMPYMVAIDTINQVVSVVTHGADGQYNVPVKYMLCSTGSAKDPTPPGIFLMPDDARYDWLFFKKFKSWVRYPVRITEDYFFHSLLYRQKNLNTQTASSLRNLGTAVSHGCIRLYDHEVQWISENVQPGSLVVVYEGIYDPAFTQALKP